MTAALQKETNSYWNLIKDAESEVKLALIQRLSMALTPVVKASQEPSVAPVVTPAMRRRISKARKEYADGETISCRTPQEMQQFFDSL